MSINRVSRREMIIGTGLGAAGLILPSQAAERARPDQPEPGTLRFGVIADVHQDVMHDGERRLGEFLDAMRESQPDFILQLGDFCVPRESNDRFMALWNGFEGERHHVIGNHETDGGYSREQVVEYFGMPSRYYSFDKSGVHVVVLDGNDRGGSSGGYPRFVAEDQLAWLKDDLASTDLPTVVVIHQPLDSVDGVDNRAQVRSILEVSNKSQDGAKVIAVLSGHSHLDYCRLINGIHYVMINSASYQWVGSDYKHASYPPEVHQRAGSLDRTCPYRDSLWAMVTIDLERQSIAVQGRTSEWVGPSPIECGVDTQKGYWGWDPLYSRPQISDRKFPVPSVGDLGW